MSDTLIKVTPSEVSSYTDHNGIVNNLGNSV